MPQVRERLASSQRVPRRRDTRRVLSRRADAQRALRRLGDDPLGQGLPASCRICSARLGRHEPCRAQWRVPRPVRHCQRPRGHGRRRSPRGGAPPGMSAYRSDDQQAQAFTEWSATDGLAAALRTSARPGHSEHQLGTAIDFGSLDSAPWDATDWGTPTWAMALQQCLAVRLRDVLPEDWIREDGVRLRTMALPVHRPPACGQCPRAGH